MSTVFYSICQLYFSQFVNCTSFNMSSVFPCTIIISLVGGREHTAGASWSPAASSAGGRCDQLLSRHTGRQLYFYQLFNSISLNLSSLFLCDHHHSSGREHTTGASQAEEGATDSRVDTPVDAGRSVVWSVCSAQQPVRSQPPARAETDTDRAIPGHRSRNF